MKKIRIFALASFLLTVSVAAAAPYGFSHGPYLQELTPTGVTFVFTTSDKGFSWVELRSPEREITRHYAVKDGLRDAYNTFCTIQQLTRCGRRRLTTIVSARSGSMTSNPIG